MKLVTHFDDFLRDTVNLNQTRIDRLNGHIDAIKGFLRKSDYAPKISSFSAQGSWAHKTIIKPPENKEFDADLVVFVEPVDGWSPKDYIDDLYRVFKASNVYKDKTGRNTRCVTLDYSGDFHLDVVPCLVRGNFLTEDEYQVCNRKDDKFETTDPEGYTRWLSERRYQRWIFSKINFVNNASRQPRKRMGFASARIILSRCSYFSENAFWPS